MGRGPVASTAFDGWSAAALLAPRVVELVFIRLG